MKSPFLPRLNQLSPKLIKLAQQLVQINSVHNNEIQCAKLLQKFFSDFGISSKIIGPKGKRRSLIAEFGHGKKSLMFNGHLDTVPAGDFAQWKFPPFSGRIVGSRMYGRGTVDMKCADAAAAIAAVMLYERRSQLNGKLVVLFNYDEEDAQEGIRDALKRGIWTDSAIVMETVKNNGGIGIGARGVYRFNLTAHGKTGHTGYRHSGINATTVLAKLILALDELKPTFKQHSLFTPGYVVPGTMIHGGHGINVYPNECTAAIDCRLTLSQDKKSILKDIKACLTKVAKRHKDIKYSISELDYTPVFLTNPNEAIVISASNSLKSVLGKKQTYSVMGGTTDANLLSEAGVNCVIFGPNGANAHTEDEYASIPSMKNACHAYALTALDYLS